MAKRSEDDETRDEKKKRKRIKKEENEQETGRSQEENNETKTRRAPDETPSAKKPKQLEESSFIKKNLDLVVSLLPASLGNTESSVEESLRNLLLKYSDGVGGILLAFENVKIKMDKGGLGRGWISNELPYVHYDVSCDTLVFAPKIGGKISGVINECFPSHISILVYSYFNAMVSAENLRACGYSFDSVLQNWVAEGGNQALSNEEKITFVIEKMHECEGTVSIEGTNPNLALLVDT